MSIEIFKHTAKEKMDERRSFCLRANTVQVLIFFLAAAFFEAKRACFTYIEEKPPLVGTASFLFFGGFDVFIILPFSIRLSFSLLFENLSYSSDDGVVLYCLRE